MMMEGNTSGRFAEGESIRQLISVDVTNVSYGSSATDTSHEGTPLKATRKPSNMGAINMDLDVDAIEPLDESKVESLSMVNIITERTETTVDVAAVHNGVIVVQAIFGLAATVVVTVALLLPQWMCNTEILKNGTSNACCGPWRICDVLMTLDNEVAFDSFEEIGSLGVATICLLCFFSLIALIQTSLLPKLCVEVPWAQLIKVKMITSVCISILYVVTISIVNKMIADLKVLGFKPGHSIDIMYSGFVASILLFGIILVEYCTLTLRKDPPPILNV